MSILLWCITHNSSAKKKKTIIHSAMSFHSFTITQLQERPPHNYRKNHHSIIGNYNYFIDSVIIQNNCIDELPLWKWKFFFILLISTSNQVFIAVALSISGLCQTKVFGVQLIDIDLIPRYSLIITLWISKAYWSSWSKSSYFSPHNYFLSPVGNDYSKKICEN